MDSGFNPDSKTLWIGDLDTYMDESYLNSIMNTLDQSQFLASIKVIKDKQTGLPQRYGFLQFNTRKNAENFMQEFNGKLIPNTSNKYFKIKWASYGGGVKPSNINLSSSTGEISIYIGDLDVNVTEAKLFEFFKSKYPSVFSAKIIYDNNTKVSKGYGFVKFMSHEEAQRAITECNGMSFGGKNIKVSHAYLKNKDETKEEELEHETSAGQMIRIYQQYYSMVNDPVLKAVYEKQMEQNFGSESSGKKTFKQNLQNVRSLSYPQTQQSEYYLSTFSRSIAYQAKKQMEAQIFS